MENKSSIFCPKLKKSVAEADIIFRNKIENLDRISEDIKGLEDYLNKNNIGIETCVSVLEEEIDGITTTYKLKWVKQPTKDHIQRYIIMVNSSYYCTIKGLVETETRLYESKINIRIKLHKYVHLLVDDLVNKFKKL
jgi:hypothetical protein